MLNSSAITQTRFKDKLIFNIAADNSYSLTLLATLLYI